MDGTRDRLHIPILLNMVGREFCSIFCSAFFKNRADFQQQMRILRICLPLPIAKLRNIQNIRSHEYECNVKSSM